MTSTVAVSLTTTSTAMRVLGLNREQVDRLIRVGLLPVVGTHGRTRLLDPAELSTLASRRHLSTAKQGQGLLEALAVHLGPLVQDPRGQQNQRQWLGWDARAAVPPSAWQGWWNTGPAIAESAVGLPLLSSVSGFIVDVHEIVGWAPHPVDPGYVRFDTHPARPALRRRYQDARFHVDAGTVWQRLYV